MSSFRNSSINRSDTLYILFEKLRLIDFSTCTWLVEGWSAARGMPVDRQWTYGRSNRYGRLWLLTGPLPSYPRPQVPWTFLVRLHVLYDRRRWVDGNRWCLECQAAASVECQWTFAWTFVQMGKQAVEIPWNATGGGRGMPMDVPVDSHFAMETTLRGKVLCVENQFAKERSLAWRVALLVAPPITGICYPMGILSWLVLSSHTSRLLKGRLWVIIVEN